MKELLELEARQKEANSMADDGKHKFFSVHECDMCCTRGVGENDLNLICDDCRDALPTLLKSVKDLEPLREVFQCYQDAKESIEATGSTEWWLEKFAKTVDKLLE